MVRPSQRSPPLPGSPLSHQKEKHRRRQSKELCLSTTSRKAPRGGFIGSWDPLQGSRREAGWVLMRVTLPGKDELSHLLQAECGSTEGMPRHPLHRGPRRMKGKEESSQGKRGPGGLARARSRLQGGALPLPAVDQVLLLDGTADWGHSDPPPQPPPLHVAGWVEGLSF